MTSGMWTRRAGRAGMPIMMALTLTACAPTTVGGGSGVFCRVARPISWSVADSDQTIREVKAHNAVGRTLCGW